MIAIKKSYEFVSNILTEEAYGSLPGIEWVNDSGNTFRVVAINPLNVGHSRRFVISVTKEIKPIGEDLYIPYGSYEFVVDDQNYRSLTTGLLVEDSEALNEDGTIKSGYLTDAQFFVLMIAYNVDNLPLSLFSFIYTSLSNKEGVTFG